MSQKIYFWPQFQGTKLSKSFDLSTMSIKRKMLSYLQKCQSTDNLFPACHLFPSYKRQIEKILSDPINIRPIWIERSNDKKKRLFAPKTNKQKFERDIRRCVCRNSLPLSCYNCFTYVNLFPLTTFSIKKLCFMGILLCDAGP